MLFISLCEVYLDHIPCPDWAIIIPSKQDPPCNSEEEIEDYIVELPPSPLYSPSNSETTIVTWTRWPYRFWRSRVWTSQRWYWALYRIWSPGQLSDQTSGSITESITSSLHHTLYQSASVQCWAQLLMSVRMLASFPVLHHSWLFVLPSDDSCGGGLGTRLYVCMWYIMDIYCYNIHLASWHSLMYTSKSITAYSCVLYLYKTKTSLHTIVYCCILMYTIVYYWIVWINEHYSILLYILFTVVYCSVL